MENYDKIIELLEKQNKTPEEEKLFDSLQKDEQTAAFISGYLKLRSALNKAHVGLDDLSSYILYKNNNPADDSESFRIPAVEAHLRECKKCTAEFRLLQQEYTGIEEYLDENLFSDRKEVKSTAVYTPSSRKSSFRPVYAFASVLLVGLVYLALFAVSGITTPDHLEFASINESSEVYLTRGRASDEFLKSFEALENKDYNSALNYLRKDIEHNPKDETIFYSYYVMGLTHLQMSEKRILGLFPSYDSYNAREGINNLKNSVEMNTSGKFENIKLDAFFYIAKGSLMLDDKITAKEYLQLVISGKGSKMDEAAVMMEELE